MTYEVEYEVLGIDGDDVEFCASSNNEDEALHYAIQYTQDYEQVDVVEVFRKLRCSYKQGKKV